MGFRKWLAGQGERHQLGAPEPSWGQATPTVVTWETAAPLVHGHTHLQPPSSCAELACRVRLLSSHASGRDSLSLWQVAVISVLVRAGPPENAALPSFESMQNVQTGIISFNN